MGVRPNGVFIDFRAGEPGVSSGVSGVAGGVAGSLDEARFAIELVMFAESMWMEDCFGIVLNVLKG